MFKPSHSKNSMSHREISHRHSERFLNITSRDFQISHQMNSQRHVKRFLNVTSIEFLRSHQKISHAYVPRGLDRNGRVWSHRSLNWATGLSQAGLPQKRVTRTGAMKVSHHLLSLQFQIHPQNISISRTSAAKEIYGQENHDQNRQRAQWMNQNGEIQLVVVQCKGNNTNQG